MSARVFLSECSQECLGRAWGKIKYDGSLQAVYAKGGSKPKPRITFDGKAGEWTIAVEKL